MIKLKKSKKKCGFKSFFKNSKNKIITIIVLTICLVFILNPSVYSKSCLNAISVWALNVLPMLLPFFIFTRIIVLICPPKKSVLDKPFKKFYNTPNGSFLIFFLSVISGYPMGAKLISDMYENKYIDNDDALAMLSFCSISGPMFMIGTVGVSIFHSYKAGLIIMIANLLASIFNGLIFRKRIKSKQIYNKKEDNNFLKGSNLQIKNVDLALNREKNLNKTDKIKDLNIEKDRAENRFIKEKLEDKTDEYKEKKIEQNSDNKNENSNVLADSVYDSLNSILIVGVYIMLSFLIIDLLKNIGFISNVASAICGVFNVTDKQNVVESVLSGLVEITRGNLDLASTNISLQAKTIISSGLIGFGGISVLMQSSAFIKNLNLPLNSIVTQKVCQGLLSTLFAIPLSFLV